MGKAAIKQKESQDDTQHFLPFLSMNSIAMTGHFEPDVDSAGRFRMAGIVDQLRE
jgi:hypothetical protein